MYFSTLRSDFKPANQTGTAGFRIVLPDLCVTCIRWSVNRLWAVHRRTVSDYNIPETITIYPPSVQLCYTQKSGHSEHCPTYNTDEDLDALLDGADGHI